ncbi:hypothetical protein [Deinococcus soli (ex Cha et al. 2016)]|uniref:phage major capsid protein n=1 Tax=Deinococcus soli (ex Cha et al. 2016) TaxID=1309411 RepID=UPI00166CC1E0|nr:hypothetical protein [Deinococcus soli (ex Cha et al. 2016)]GGB69469.1 hypothetical protein GCM10008019_27050 [Deinococcus soli (ex Cha et al. 2016)]
MTKLAVTQIRDINKDLKQEAKSNRRTFGAQIEMLAMTGQIAAGIVSPTRVGASGRPVPTYRQVLAAAGVDIRGARTAQTIEEAFFRNDADPILFPYYIEESYREIQNQMRNQLSFTNLVSERIPLTGQTIAQIPTLREDETNTNGDTSRVSEGAEFPTLLIEMGDQTVPLLKYGGNLKASKEALLNIRLPLFNRWLTVLARRETLRKTRNAIKVILNGHGPDTVAPNVDATGGGASIAEIVKGLQLAARYGAQPSIITGDAEVFGTLFNLDILSSPASTFSGAESLRATGQLPSILGMAPLMAPIPSELDGSNKLLLVDPERGLIEFHNPSMDLVEYDYLMSRQLNIVQISEMSGLAKPDQGVGVTVTFA